MVQTRLASRLDRPTRTNDSEYKINIEEIQSERDRDRSETKTM